MIRIVDYGLGNVQAFANMYKRLGFDAARAKSVGDLADASRIILPGVGAFDHAMELLHQSGMRPALEHLVLEKGVPVLGICVGMQILASSSEEGRASGLGWVPGHVRSFHSVPESAQLPMPHMGWNDVVPAAGAPLFAGLGADARFYFLHSYFFDCEERSHVLARASYGFDFGCAVAAGNVYGVQFHPEKSHHYGATLLKNFAELAHAQA
ncbi:imidazole glycerol phosphate synthase subunit HisH [Massilia terrae]|uniref:Imidazole glycerol phosphate synthase subunit HisH n=1 Tax=Massilia terrae TaxID=1811224 RepID=A0ABT2CW01_9BURK|nr:imidazole glycerol phosphate synthase subunit HisH [Massilia terrae]MCS0658154.1 imidazole glycerol phosphate synthase subunit HisH [Massilia terrae]